MRPFDLFYIASLGGPLVYHRRLIIIELVQQFAGIIVHQQHRTMFDFDKVLGHSVVEELSQSLIIVTHVQ